MKVIDIVKPEPKTELEKWARWMNRIQTSVLTAPWSTRTKIEVTQL